MDGPHPGARPVGWTELIAGTVATLFAVASALLLMSAVVGGPGLARAATKPDNGAVTGAPVNTGPCAAPPMGGMRLGTQRVYAEGGIRLDPVPVAITPPVSAQDAYARAALKPPGCQTEELLAYYSGGDPPETYMLAWVVVSTSACASKRCVFVSPVDATTGRVIAPTFFAIAPG